MTPLISFGFAQDRLREPQDEREGALCGGGA